VPEELSGVDLGFLEEDGNAEVHERLCEVDHRLPVPDMKELGYDV